MHRYANPTRFLQIAQPLTLPLGLAALLLLVAGLYYALFQSPPDYQQGESVRIMYVHVPAAWLALGCYTGIAVASAVFIVWRHPLADVAARASAPIGATFTAICLVTGALWGRPTWGTWWAWDARLTSVLILLFLYLGYMILATAFDDRTRGARAAAILALVGAVNIPIIKFSVDWWNTLHQPASVFRAGGSAIHPSMLLPLLLMAGAYLCLYLCLLLVRMRTEIAAQRLEGAARRTRSPATLEPQPS